MSEDAGMPRLGFNQGAYIRHLLIKIAMKFTILKKYTFIILQVLGVKTLKAT
jgi:hypothetical protein